MKKMTLLKKANFAYKEKKFQEAYETYCLILKNSPELKSTISFNLNLTLSKIKKTEKLVNKEEKQKKIEFIEKEPDDLTQKQKHIINKIENYKINFDHYYEKNKIKDTHLSPPVHYIKFWKKRDLIIPGFFDCKMYRDIYDDIEKSDIPPLYHYISYGKEEGRLGTLDKMLKTGDLKYLPEKETVVFMSHESSATGAPLLGYNIVDGLKKWYNVIHIVIKKSNIKDIIPKNCFLYVEDISDNPEKKTTAILKNLINNYSLKAVILNSVETFPALCAAAKLKLPTVSLIHEFSDYTRPFGKMVHTLFYATEVITPAGIITSSILEELKTLTGINTGVNNISQFPQGKLPYLPDTFGDEDTPEQLYKKIGIQNQKDTKIIVGSGYVQTRKGVDLFLATARYIKKNYEGKCKFIWVGDGYDPQHDFSCSVWLQRDIKYYGLENDFIFLEHQKNLDTVFGIADIFCLTSRMDPFPNVAIDAMEANLPIACFENASGTEEFIQKYNADHLTAEYLDTYGLANQIIQHFKKDQKKKAINAELVKTKLSFKIYMDSIKKIIDQASNTTRATQASVCKILDNKMIDASFYGVDQDPELAAYHYVSLYKKGLHKMSPNPLPGFSQLQWIMKHGWNPTTTPLELSIEQGVELTHQCKLVPNHQKEINPINFKYAVHLHLYYVDLAETFKNYFKNLPGNYHLYITIINQEDNDKVFKKFKNCGASYVEVVVVENIGRDIGPMIFNLRKQLTTNGYEVIGHFHSKKSLSTDGDIGNRWREYLMQNLVGGDGVSQSILSFFKDPKVGLIFAEDKHVVDIGENQYYVDKLCETLDIPKITNTHVFPLGNMFWARLDAIKQFFDLDEKIVLQAEPLPYDGSYMHALERISPNLVEKNQYQYLTVYNPGTTW